MPDLRDALDALVGPLPAAPHPRDLRAAAVAFRRRRIRSRAGTALALLAAGGTTATALTLRPPFRDAAVILGPGGAETVTAEPAPPPPPPPSPPALVPLPAASAEPQPSASFLPLEEAPAPDRTLAPRAAHPEAVPVDPRTFTRAIAAFAVGSAGRSTWFAVDEAERRVAVAAELAGQPWGGALSPDGTRLAVVDLVEEQVRVVDLREPTPDGTLHIAAASASDVTWSPDGTRLAWAQDPDEPLVLVADLVRRTLTRQPLTGGGVADLQWAPDGTRLLVETLETDSSAAAAWVLTVDGTTAPVPLPAGFFVASPRAWFPDGARLLGGVAGAGPVVLPLDGSAAQRVGGAADDPMAVSPDGNLLLVAATRASQDQSYRVVAVESGETIWSWPWTEVGDFAVEFVGDDGVLVVDQTPDGTVTVAVQPLAGGAPDVLVREHNGASSVVSPPPDGEPDVITQEQEAPFSAIPGFSLAVPGWVTDGG